MADNIDCYIFHGLRINKCILNSNKAIPHDFHRIRTATKSEIRFAHHTKIIATSICNTYFWRDPFCLTHTVSIQDNTFYFYPYTTIIVTNKYSMEKKCNLMKLNFVALLCIDNIILIINADKHGLAQVTQGRELNVSKLLL